MCCIIISEFLMPLCAQLHGIRILTAGTATRGSRLQPYERVNPWTAVHQVNIFPFFPHSLAAMAHGSEEGRVGERECVRCTRAQTRPHRYVSRVAARSADILPKVLGLTVDNVLIKRICRYTCNNQSCC